MHQFVTAGPSPSRIAKLTELVKKALSENKLTPDEAAHLAGKLNFVCSWVFGGVGKALLKPVYSRQHTPFPQSSLNAPLRAALLSLLGLLPLLQPLTLPDVQERQPKETSCTVRRRLCDLGRFPSAPSGHPVRRFQQRLGDSLSEARTRLAFRTKAFIFWLEALAQILSLAAVSSFLSGDVVCFVDNSASEHALRKRLLKRCQTNQLVRLVLGVGCFEKAQRFLR